MDRFGLVAITAAITVIIMLLAMLVISSIYVASEDEVLVITKVAGVNGQHVSAIWMSKDYLKKRHQHLRYKLPTERVLVVFE